MNIARQPSSARIRPPASVPTAGPSAMPTATAAVGHARALRRDVAGDDLRLPGKAMLSPTPSITRSTSSETKPPTNPMSKVLAAHRITPQAISR